MHPHATRPPLPADRAVRAAPAISAAVPADAEPVIARHFRMLLQLSIETEDETCQLSRRPLARGTTDFVSETLAGARDLEEVMRRIARAYNLLHGGSFNRVERQADRLVYRIDDAGFPFAFDADPDAATTVMEGVLIFVHSMLSMVVSSPLDPWLRMVATRWPGTGAADGLLGYWHVPVRRHANAYLLEYAPGAAALGIPPDLGTFTSQDVYARILATIDARQADAAHGDPVAQVRSLLGGGITDQAAIARRLGLSVATLRRRLAAQGADFRTLRAEALARRATVLLANGRAVPDIADTLGFCDARSFSRAFKAWHAVTPAQYRGRMRGEPQNNEA
ncbi:helix-turn-helix domain-containing protein [Sphingomonas sp. CCH16-B10]|uniref:helix-turn-helix domain-containing protein n=1 Tax=Sphingomonas sp. CCH16-B10 TaxID=1768755 RepID=UPI0008359FD5|nr:helix-turn-helix domain-containing protein [Sphingomonas sp. CCH16-B10]